MNPVRSRDRFANKIIFNHMHSRYNKLICGLTEIAICF